MVDMVPPTPRRSDAPPLPGRRTDPPRPQRDDAGRPGRVPLFTDIDGTRVTWPDGHTKQVDTILFATGYRPDLPYLADLGALDHHGRPRQIRGLSTSHPGLGYVGLEWQRSLASATLRGVGRDARYVTTRLLRHRTALPVARCCEQQLASPV